MTKKPLDEHEVFALRRVPHKGGGKGRGRGKRRRGAFRSYTGSQNKTSGAKANMAEDEQEPDQSYWGKGSQKLRKEANSSPRASSSLM